MSARKSASRKGPHAPAVRMMPGIVVLVLLLVFPMTTAAQDWLSSWKLDIGVSSVYDNNILRYSDKYVTRFDNREDEGRFHIDTRDDVVLVASIRASAVINLIGSLNTTAAVDARRRTYTHNPVKDWSLLSFSLRQDLSKKLAMQIGYSYMPSFYVRHYRDDDWVKQYGYTPITFQPFDFKKDEFGGWVQYALFSGTRVRSRFAYMRYFYNEHFTEYDCRNTLLGFDVYQTVQKNIKVNASFEVVHSRDGGNAEKDPSSDENAFGLGVEFQLPKVFGRANSFGLEGEYVRRFYTSTLFLEIDPEHAGRQDFEYLLSATYSFELLDNLELALNYAWRKRDTKTSASENAVYLSDEKDYRQYQIGLEAKYTLNFIPQ